MQDRKSTKEKKSLHTRTKQLKLLHRPGGHCSHQRPNAFAMHNWKAESIKHESKVKRSLRGVETVRLPWSQPFPRSLRVQHLCDELWN